MHAVQTSAAAPDPGPRSVRSPARAREALFGHGRPLDAALTMFRKRFDRLKFRVLLASVAVVTLIGGLLVDSVVNAEQRVEEAVERDLVSHSQSTLVSLSEAFNLVDYTLKRARQEWLETGKLRPHGEFIQDFPNFKELIMQVAVIGADGYLEDTSLAVQASRVYLGDREHFRVHIGAARDDVFVSRPVVGKVSGVTTIQFTRPILGKGGEWLGVVVVSIKPDYLRQLSFGSLATAGMSAILVGQDGGVRVQSVTDRSARGEAREGGSPVREASAPTLDDDSHVWRRTALGAARLELLVGYPSTKITDRMSSIYWSTALAFLLTLAVVGWYTFDILKLISIRTSLLMELEESNVKANSANAMKSKFVAGISHELRTPLNGILGFSELVEMSNSLDEAKQYGSIIRSSSTHLHQLVNTLLDLAKIEAGQMAKVCTVSRVWELFESVVSLHRYSAEKKGLLLTLNIAQGLPECIRTDRIKLMQVLNNLISNAVKFTDHGAIFVNVGRSGGTWEISVVDTGVGMSAEQMAGVFERFNNIKLESINTSGKEGAGLGMALCKELIELMGGTIELQSELDAGTSVKIKLEDMDDETAH